MKLWQEGTLFTCKKNLHMKQGVRNLLIEKGDVVNITEEPRISNGWDYEDELIYRDEHGGEWYIDEEKLSECFDPFIG